MKKMIGAVSLILTFSSVFAQADIGEKGCWVLLDRHQITYMQKNDKGDGKGLAAELPLDGSLYRVTVRSPTDDIEAKILKIEGESQVELGVAIVRTLPLQLILSVGSDQNKHTIEVACYK